MKNLTFFSVLLFVFTVQNIWGDIPRTLNYQGILTDNNREVVPDNNYELTFKLYDSATDGTVLWSETQSVSVADGVFNAILGSVNPLNIPFDNLYWLGITVGEGVELTPRIKLTSSAYSLNSRGVMGNSNVFPDSGNVGINTTNPTAKLHIGGTPGVDGIKFPDGTLQTTAVVENGSDGDWTISGDNMYSAVSGNIGIGTASPDNKLDIECSVSTGGIDINNTAPDGSPVIRYQIDGTTKFTMGVDRSGSSHFKIGTTSLTTDTYMKFTSWGCICIGPPPAYGDYYRLETASDDNYLGAGAFLVSNPDNIRNAVYAFTNGKGNGLYARSQGTGNALLVNHDGSSGHIAQFQSNDTAKVIIDKNGNIGINTTSPTAKLHIGGTPGVDGIKFPDGTLQTTALTGSGSDGDWTISGNNMYSAVSGNIGIGTTSPQRQLHIARADYVTLVLEDEGAGTDQKKKFINTDDGSLRLGKFTDSWDFTPQLTIDNSGNIGIGTTNPGSKLEVAGTIHSTNGGIKFPDGTLQTTAAYGGGTITGTYLEVGHSNYEGSAGKFTIGFLENYDPALVVHSHGHGGALVVTNDHIGTTVQAVNSGIGNGIYASAAEGSAGVFYKNGIVPEPIVQPVLKATAEDVSTVLVVDQSGPSGNIAEFRSDNVLKVLVAKSGNVGIGTDTPQGELDVNGTIYQRGGLLHADYVFESDYQLESIEDHARFMWTNKHLKAVPKASVDEKGCEIVEYGSQQRGIVEELEKAHIYIEQLQERIKILEEKIEKLAVKGE